MVKEQDSYYQEIKVYKLENDQLVESDRPVPQEVPVTIYLNDHEIVTLLCLGDHLKSLAVGFLKSEGLITDRANLKSITVDEEKRLVRVTLEEDTELNEKLFLRRTVTSGCGKGITFYNALDALINKKINSTLVIRIDQIFHLMRSLTEASELYKTTGAVHNSALATVEDLVFFRTDIGRHNAVDKIYGDCFLNSISLEDKVLLTTGRITSEILIKTRRMGIPILISRSGATSLAVSLGYQFGVTLIGYVRAKKMVVYSGHERIR
jgi:FdhD protein